MVIVMSGAGACGTYRLSNVSIDGPWNPNCEPLVFTLTKVPRRAPSELAITSTSIRATLIASPIRARRKESATDDSKVSEALLAAHKESQAHCKDGIVRRLSDGEGPADQQPAITYDRADWCSRATSR